MRIAPSPGLASLMRVALSIFIACVLLVERAHAETAANANSPLGVNLAGVNYWSPEQPFLNIFKTTGVSGTTPSGWVTHAAPTWDTGEEQYLQLDSNGYPTTLKASTSDPNSPQKFNSVGVLLLRGLPDSNAGTGLPYRSGRYIVLYDGQGTLTYGGDATLVSSAPGRDVIQVDTPTTGGGLLLNITSTDPNHTGNYIRNIRVVKAEEESLLDAGSVFEPIFLQTIRNFHILRFMDWSDVNSAGGAISNWANRTHVDDAGWGSTRGVPLEVDIELANAVSADPWLNVPIAADDDYVQQMATLVHSSLNSDLKVYVELSNEVWNSIYPQYSYAILKGESLWSKTGASPFDYNRNWFGMRTAQVCDLWKSVWGIDSSRVICVLGAQAANTYTATESLNCPFWSGAGNAPCSAHNINAVAIAPYFGFQAPPAWATSSGGLSSLFQQLEYGGLISGSAGGTLLQVSDWESAYKTALAPYKLPFIAYEGGQSFVGFPTYGNGSAMVSLYTAANRSMQMRDVYTTALSNWKANGGEAYVLFDDYNAPSTYGEWGLLESFMDATSPLAGAPPKWQAAQNFIATNACWWSECAGIVGSNAPQTPKNFHASSSP